jgi:hypothetical protein
MFIQDTENAPQLHSALNNSQYLDAISAPKVDHATKNDTKKKPAVKKDKADPANDDGATSRPLLAAGKAKVGSSGAGGR